MVLCVQKDADIPVNYVSTGYVNAVIVNPDA